MVSIDANILLYALNSACPEHAKARAFMASLQLSEDVAMSEFILIEFYVLLRNPAVLKNTLTEREAAETVAIYRRHPRWRLLGFPRETQAFHNALWKRAKTKPFARRRIYDVRTGLALVYQGVTEFATANVKDFKGLGFARVWNPLLPAAN